MSGGDGVWVAAMRGCYNSLFVGDFLIGWGGGLIIIV